MTTEEKKTAGEPTAGKKKTTRKRKNAPVGKVPADEAAAIVAAAPKRLKPGKGKSHHLKNLVRFREIDIDPALSKFIAKVTRRGGFKDPTEATLAMLRYVSYFATQRGLGSFVPQLKGFKGKK
jgi:hypothetical protein